MAKYSSGTGGNSSLFSSCTLYLANLPVQATVRDVARVFEPITGRLVECRVSQGGTGRLVCQRSDLAELAYSTELAVLGRPVIVRLQLPSGQSRANQRRRHQRNQHRNCSGTDATNGTAIESGLCRQASRALRLDSDSSLSQADSSVRSSRQALEQAVRERDACKLKSAAASWPGGPMALAQFCSGVGGQNNYRGGGCLPLVHDLVSEAAKPAELLAILIECCRRDLDEQQAADTISRLVNSRDQYGFTPLHRAVRSGSDQAVEVLLANGADVTAATDRDRRTALHIHLWLGCGPLAYRLLDCGADPDACDADNWTALHWCAKNGYLEFARHLVCDRNARLFRSQGSTLSPLKLCLQQINQCANSPTAQTEQQRRQQRDTLTALFDIARLLLRHGADLPSQSFLADWLAAQPAASAAPPYPQLIRLLALEGADFPDDVLNDVTIEAVEDCRFPRSLLQLCRLGVRRRLRRLSDGRSILSRLHRLPLPARVLNILDLPVADDGQHHSYESVRAQVSV